MAKLHTNQETNTRAGIIDICMPSLGADMTEGMLVQWLVKEDDFVQSGDVIAVLETQKGAIDMEVYHTGTIDKLLVQPVVTVAVGTRLATLKTVEGKSTGSASDSAPSREANRQEQSVKEAVEPVTKPKASIPYLEPGAGVMASPAARKQALEQGLDLSSIPGSGPNGAVLLRDMAKVQPGAKPGEKQSSGSALAQMRSAIASAMVKSKREIPHFYLSQDILLDEALSWLQELNQGRPPEQHVLLLALLLKAVAVALKKYPLLNGFYLQNGFVSANGIHIGNVISLRGGGMQVPAIHNVDRLSIEEIMQALRDISERSRSGHLRTSELTDASITVTNLGERGADRVFGVIYPPQVALIGFGKPRKIPVVKGDSVEAGDVICVSLSADHRVIDGALAAKFLHYLAKKLKKPECL